MPLKGIFLRVTFPKVPCYGIMATQLLATSITVHHLLKCGIVAYLLNLCHLSYTITLVLCSVSQLERCFHVSIHELILSCSNLKKIDSSKILPFLSLSCWMKFSKQRRQDQFESTNQQPREDSWIMKFLMLSVPLSFYLTP